MTIIINLFIDNYRRLNVFIVSTSWSFDYESVTSFALHAPHNVKHKAKQSSLEFCNKYIYVSVRVFMASSVLQHTYLNVPQRCFRINAFACETAYVTVRLLMKPLARK